MKKKEKLRSFLSFILAFMLMFFMGVVVISSFVRYKLINSEYYLDVLQEDNTEGKIYQSLVSDIHYALVVSNLPQDIADGIISEEEVKFEYDSYFNSILMYLKTGIDNVKDIDTEVYLKRFDEKLNKYFEESSVINDDNLKKDVSELRLSLQQILKNYLEIVDYNILSNSNDLRTAVSYLVMFNCSIYYSLFIGIIILCALIISLWYKVPSQGIIWISRSMIATGIVFTVIFLSALISKFYNNIILYTPYIKKFVAEIIEEDVKWFLSCGIIIFIAGIIIYVITKVINNKNKLLEG